MKPLQQNHSKLKWPGLFLFLLMGIFLSMQLPARAQEEEEEEIVEEEFLEKQVVLLSELATLMRADESEIIMSDLEIVIGEKGMRILYRIRFFIPFTRFIQKIAGPRKSTSTIAFSIPALMPPLYLTDGRSEN